MKIKLSSIMLLTAVLCFSGCKKNENIKDNIFDDAINVKINLLGTESQDAPALKMSTGLSMRTKQTQSIPFNNEYSIKATLEQLNNSRPLSTKASNGPGATINQSLADNIKYCVMVYSEQGDYLTYKNFVYTKGATAGFNLDDGKTYIFHISSFNDAVEVPDVKDYRKLSTAYISVYSNAPSYMSDKKTMKVQAGKVNNLDVVLKHHYAEITTTIDASAIGNITGATNVTLKPSAKHSSVYISGEQKDWYNTNVGAPVNFRSLGKSVITSEPTTVQADATDDGTLNIGSMTINGMTKTNITFNGFSIQPGAKYNLKLTLQRNGPHVDKCGGDIYWDPTPFPDFVSTIDIPYEGGNGGVLEPNNSANARVDFQSFPNKYYWSTYAFISERTVLDQKKGVIRANTSFAWTANVYNQPTRGGRATFFIKIGDKRCVYTVHRKNAAGGYD